MSTRSVIVRLEAEVSQYVAGMGRAAQATDTVAGNIVRTRRNIADNEQHMKELGGSMLKVGAIGVAALGATAKAAMDWETAWAGVTKTVEGTPAQLNQLESGLRNLAKTLPVTHTEIAGVAEAAGQLGVARKDVVGFTKTMIDLGVSTNLTAEEAATDIAQISNVMGTLARDGTDGISRFGATLVALGNDGASTEKEILSMAQRIAGAAATVGASEVEVLALSNTLASMGVRAELGGGVATRVLLKMYGAIQDGGDKLSAFSKTAGMSADEFSKAFADSPVKALDAVNQGLARTKEEGGNVVQAMTDMGLKGTENMQVMLSLAASGSLLNDSLELGGKSWAENTALVEEAGKRYDTTASKVQISWNKIKDAAITGGQALLPVIQMVVETVGGLASAFGELPAPAQQGIILVAALGAGSLLLGGILLSTIPKIAATRAAWTALNATQSRIPGTLGKIGKAAGIAAVALVALGAVVKIGSAIWGGAAVDVEAFGQAILNAGGSMSATDNLFKDTASGINGVGDAIMQTKQTQETWSMGAWLGIADLLGITDQYTKVRDGMGAMDDQMAKMVGSGKIEQAGKQFKGLAEEAVRSAEAQGKTPPTIDEILNLMPAYSAALKQAASDANVSLEGQDLLNFALGKTPDALTAATVGYKTMQEGIDKTGVALDGLVEDMDKFIEQLFKTGQLTMSSREAQFAYEESLRGVQEQVNKITEAGGAMGNTLNENATDFNMTTDAGKLANDTFQGLVSQGMARVEKMAKAGVGQDELQGKLTGTYEDLLTVAGQFGVTGDAAVQLTRDALGVPDNVDIKTWMDSQAKNMANETKNAVNGIPSGKTVTIYGNVDPSFRAAALEAYQLGQVKSAPGVNVNTETSANPFSDGGAVYGKGTGTSDSINVKLSKGEHVLTAAEVAQMGGHAGVYQMRSQVRQGNLSGSSAARSVGSMAPARQLVSVGASAPPAVNVTGTFMNPFTGKEVVAVMQNIAVTEAKNAVSAANDNAGRRPAR